jgi:ribonuclease HI
MIHIYSDGACSGNKRGCGIGAYGYVILDMTTKKRYKNGGVILDTTNNIMELVSVIAALKELHKILNNKTEDTVCVVHSDSKYVVDNWNENRFKWLDKGWLNSKGGNILNRKYWELLWHAVHNFRDVQFLWVKGHADNQYNEVANSIAVSLSQKKRRELEKHKLQKEQKSEGQRRLLSMLSKEPDATV